MSFQLLEDKTTTEYSDVDGWTTVDRRSDQKSRTSNTTGTGAGFLSVKRPVQTQRSNYVPKNTEQKTTLFVNLKQIKLCQNNTAIHAKVYNYIKGLIMTQPEPDVIRMTRSLGVSPNDKTICLTNLFFICVRQDKTSLMQRIIDSVNDFERMYMVNAYDRKYTPIMQAAYNGSANSVKLLLTWGADVNVINVDGEDIYSATAAGVKDAIAKHPNLEIFLKPKFQEINTYIQWWKDNMVDTPSDELTVSVMTMKVSDDEPNKLIDTKSNIVSQIETILESCIDDSMTTVMKKLFEEINQMVKSKVIESTIIDSVIEPFRKVLELDYEDEFAALNY